MNTPKLPPLTKELEDHLSWYSDPKADRIRAMIRDYTIAAIEAQGVPDVEDLRDSMVAISAAVAEQNDMLAQKLLGETLVMLASAPPAPQTEDDSAASINDTNAVLAARYFELLKVVEQYEKSGVTCQTFRHFISEPCAECNSPGICGKQAKPQPLSDSQALEIFNDLEKFMDQIEDEEVTDEYIAGQSLWFILNRVSAMKGTP